MRKHEKPAAGGFTLLEVLVVLALVGLLTAFSLPQFSIIRDRLTFTLNRESFERELGGLSYLAFKEGRPLILDGKYPRDADEIKTSTDVFQTADAATAFLAPGQLRAVRPVTSKQATLTLPEQWQVTVETPIVYQASGFCGGGTVKLVIGQLRYDYDLKAPTCQAALSQ